jgi:excisionase family DNA binding protein
MNEEDLITVREAAKLRGVSRARIHQWLQGGRLTRYEKYEKILVSKSELLAIEALPAGRPITNANQGEE